ncbi:MAG: tRNA epoxyqueuosine(34) reductase QueG [Capsulimonas sp.]|nr:tRNA epoxyqueuosine(34) reductase QueG [Capsulimonas sp.]
MSTGTRSTADSPGALLSNLIKQRASELGFALCGVANADPPPHHRKYQQWLAEGRAGEMMYLHRQEPKRGDLSEVLPGVRSVVSLAWNYSPEDGRPSDPPQTECLTGAVARYARFDDYHDLIWARLQSLLDTILDECPEAHGKLYCDTGPITERDLAMRAGLGWIGKHTNLISRELGNWFFLAEVLLDIDLPHDAPEVPHCGSCTRCIPACPTGAIVAPYTLDARRCISYLTIELKGSIPVELRPLIGARIYGCDECLAVCQWNKFAQKATDTSVQPRADLTTPDLLELLALDATGFNEKFRHSPIKRTKRRGLLRNVCVALGNIGDPRAIPALTAALENDPEPLIREHAAWALERIAEKNSAGG